MRSTCSVISPPRSPRVVCAKARQVNDTTMPALKSGAMISNSSLRNSRLNQLANECGRQASTSRESNGSSARIVSGEVCLECCDCIAAHRVKRTVVCGRFEAGDEFLVQAERGHPVADALLRAGCCSMDSSTHLLERGAVRRGQAGQILVNGIRLRRHEHSPCSRQVVCQKISFCSISR